MKWPGASRCVPVWTPVVISSTRNPSFGMSATTVDARERVTWEDGRALAERLRQAGHPTRAAQLCLAVTLASSGDRDPDAGSRHAGDADDGDGDAGRDECA